MRSLISKLMVFSFIAALSVPAMVQADEPENGWSKGACKEDAQKLCAGVTPGHGAIRDCLKQHASELSAGCKSNIAIAKDKMKERKQAIEAACKSDQDQFCKDVTPGDHREIACLHAHSDKLSASCKDALKTLPHHMGGMAPAAPQPPSK